MWWGGTRKTPGHVARELVRDVGEVRPTPLRKEEAGDDEGVAVHCVVSVSALTYSALRYAEWRYTARGVGTRKLANCHGSAGSKRVGPLPKPGNRSFRFFNGSQSTAADWNDPRYG